MVFHKHIDAENLKDPCQILLNSVCLLETGDHEISADGDPDLGLHGVLGTAIECLDAQVLFDPLEEELDAPSRLVDRSHCLGRQRKVIGKEDQILSGIRINKVDPPQEDWIKSPRFDPRKPDALVTAKPLFAIDGTRLAHLEVKIALGPDDKETACLGNSIQALIIDVCPVHDIQTSRFPGNTVEKVDIVDGSLRNIDKYWDRAFEGHLCMDLDSRLGRAEGRPREHRETQINGSGINCVNHLLDVESVRVVTVETLCFSYQNIGYIRIDPPIPVLVGVGQISPCHSSPYSHCVQERVVTQTRFDVPQAFPEGQLSEDHRKKLVAGAETFTDSGHGITLQATRQLLGIEHVGDLGENKPATVHPLLRLTPHKAGDPFQIEDTLFVLLTSDNKQYAKN